MTDADLLSFALFIWAGVMTGLWLDARRENMMTKKIIIHLVSNKDEREKFFAGFELMVKSKGDFDAR
jgi:hypothetical protein